MSLVPNNLTFKFILQLIVLCKDLCIRYTTLLFDSGEHTVMVLFADEEVPESPITVDVASSHNASLVKAEGPGLEKDGKFAKQLSLTQTYVKIR